MKIKIFGIIVLILIVLGICYAVNLNTNTPSDSEQTTEVNKNDFIKNYKMISKKLKDCKDFEINKDGEFTKIQKKDSVCIYEKSENGMIHDKCEYPLNVAKEQASVMADTLRYMEKDPPQSFMERRHKYMENVHKYCRETLNFKLLNVKIQTYQDENGIFQRIIEDELSKEERAELTKFIQHAEVCSNEELKISKYKYQMYQKDSECNLIKEETDKKYECKFPMNDDGNEKRGIIGGFAKMINDNSNFSGYSGEEKLVLLATFMVALQEESEYCKMVSK